MGGKISTHARRAHGPQVISGAFRGDIITSVITLEQVFGGGSGWRQRRGNSSVFANVVCYRTAQLRTFYLAASLDRLHRVCGLCRFAGSCFCGMEGGERKSNGY